MDKRAKIRHNDGVAMRSITKLTAGASAGAAIWTITEYGIHRWALHGPFGKGRLKWVPLGGVHRAHHADPLCSSLPGRTAGHVAIAGVAAVASIGLSGFLPTLVSRAGAAAWSAGYSCYEISHWNFHHRPARTERGQRLRDRHQQHHFGAPASNLGVTMTLWDRLFDTEAAVASSLDE